MSLVQLKGCNSEDVSEATCPEPGLLAFAFVFGLLFIFLWICLRNNQQQDVEPDAEPGTMYDPLILDDLDEAATRNEPPPPSSSARGSEPNAEDYMRWLVERCSRRRDNAPTHGCRRLYEERVTILYGLILAMRSPVETLRRGSLRTIATMSDISDDEESPSYAAIHAPASLRDAQRALNFIRAMEQDSSSGAVMSTNLIWLPTLWAEEMLIHLQMEVQARLMRRPQRSNAVIGSLAKMTCQTQSFGFF